MALEILEQYASQCYVCKTVGFKGHTGKKRLYKYANERHMTLHILQKLLSHILDMQWDPSILHLLGSL